MKEAVRTILFLSHTPMGGPFVVGSHHLARHISKRGIATLHVSKPRLLHRVGWESLARWADVQRRHKIAGTGDQPAVLDPVAVLPGRLIATLAAAGFPRPGRFLESLHAVIAASGFTTPDAVLIDEPIYGPLLPFFSSSTVVYRPTDIYRVINGRISGLGTSRLERHILARADGVVATSSAVLHSLTNKGLRAPSIVVTNGVEYEHFSRSQPSPYASDDGRLRAIYVGALDSRFDVAAVRDAAIATPACDFILVGPRSGVVERAMAGLPNAHTLGEIPYERVPGYLQHADVALLPLRHSVANVGRSPMKLYEYMAAGLPVVAPDWFHAAKSTGVVPYAACSNPGLGLAQAVAAAATLGSSRSRLQEEARSQGWSHKADQVLEFVESLTPG